MILSTTMPKCIVSTGIHSYMSSNALLLSNLYNSKRIFVKNIHKQTAVKRSIIITVQLENVHWMNSLKREPSCLTLWSATSQCNCWILPLNSVNPKKVEIANLKNLFIPVLHNRHELGKFTNNDCSQEKYTHGKTELVWKEPRKALL